MSDDNEGQDYKGEFVATGGRSEIRRPSELVPSKPPARMPRRPCGYSRAGGSVFLNPNSSQILRIDNSLSIVDRSSIFLFTMLSFEALVDMRDKW